MPTFLPGRRLVKSSKVEACIICDDVPCSCYAKKKTPGPRPKMPKDRTRSSAVIMCGPQPPTDGDLAVVEEFKQELRNRFKPKATAATAQPEMDFETAQAIRNLADAGLLTDAARAKYRDVIAPRATGDTDRRLADWRKRNGLA
jgi:hypothetical protein